MRAVFACKVYQLEVLLSETTTNPLDTRLKVGTKFGNLLLESVGSDYAIFNYIYPGFDFKMFMAINVNERELTLGFIEYTSQYDASIGQKAYTIMILESCARLLESSYIVERD